MVPYLYMYDRAFLENIVKGLKMFGMVLNPLTTNVPHHIKTGQLICIANQLTGFFMMGNIGRSWVNTLMI